jgi:hypothetical protein
MIEGSSSPSLILVLGSPRSGTTWLGKIFDSHPLVFYLHEPDTVIRTDALPYLPELDEVAAHREGAARYLDDLLRVRRPKAAASTPVFAKSYRWRWQDRLRALLIHGARVLSTAGARIGLPLDVDVPDLVRGDRRPQTVVLKSVSSLGRAPVFLEAVPSLRVVHIVRHPCSQIASRLRGRELGVLDTHTFVRSFARTRYAAGLELDETTIRGLPLEGQMACQWTIQNAMVHEALCSDPRYRLVLYEDLCRSPEGVARTLMEWCGLPWSHQTEGFLRTSTSGGSERYFGVIRDSQAEIGKWRRLLDEHQVASITDAVARTPLGRMVLERAG